MPTFTHIAHTVMLSKKRTYTPKTVLLNSLLAFGWWFALMQHWRSTLIQPGGVSIDKPTFHVDHSLHVPTLHPLLSAPFDCNIIEYMAASYSSKMIDSLRTLLVLCDSTLRDNVSVYVHSAYLDTYVGLSEGTGMVEEAYVSFLRGSAYLDLSKSAMKAAHQFSGKPIFLFVSGISDEDIESAWPPSSYPRLVVMKMTTGLLNPYFDKLLAAVLSPVQRGVIVEADTLLTPQADRLFIILRRYGHQVFPLMPTHEDVRWEDCTLYTGPKYCGNPVAYPHKDRSMDYVHAHLMWTPDSRPFLVDILLKCAPGSSGLVDCTHDEIALNYALWKAGASRHLCLMDPYFGKVDAWEKMDVEPLVAMHNQTMGFLFVHGAKQAKTAEDLIDRIEAMRGKPWLVEKGQWSSGGKVHIHEGGCIL